MEEKKSLCEQFFTQKPDMQNRIFYVQRLLETNLYLEKTLKGLPKEEEIENVFKNMIKGVYSVRPYVKGMQDYMMEDKGRMDLTGKVIAFLRSQNYAGGK